MKKLIFLSLIIVFFLGCNKKDETEESKSMEIKTEEVNYTSDTTNMKGFLAYDASSSKKRPGILVVHEWWGHNDYARNRAKMLAEMGYVALAVDMYGDGKKADHPGDAGKFAGQVMSNIENAKGRFMAAYNLLKSNQFTDTSNIAAIGYCFGGGVVLNMARMGVDLKGVVSFHGSLGAVVSAEKGAVKTKLLVCNGGDDSFVPEEQINQFKEEMTNAGVDFTFISYPGAKHSFTNPDADKFAEQFGIGVAYNKEADEKSWQDMTDFFNKIF